MNARSSRRRLPGALLPGLAFALALQAGCGEVDPVPEPTPTPAEVTSLRIDVRLTFHRAEEPVHVARSVEIPVEGPAAAPELLLAAALRALLRGPTAEEREAGIHSFFSEESADLLRSLSIEEGRAVVDFHDFRPLLPNASSSAGSFAFLAELNGTVFANSRVDEVEYRLAGSCEAFWNFLQRDCTLVPRPAEA
jgi:hypothetical protein